MMNCARLRLPVRTQLSFAQRLALGQAHLDEFHLFICQAFGVLGLFFCGLIIQLPAKKYLTFMTVFNILFSSSLPFYAQYAFAVKLPDHYLPVGGCALICLAHVALWYKSK